MSKIHLAIIGTGSIAEMHVKAMQGVPSVKLIAVQGGNAERGLKFAEKYGIEFVSDLEVLAARPDLHGVTIATTSGTHAISSLPFLKRGKAVLCEKPMDVRLERIDEMLRVAEQNRATLAGVFQMRLGAGAKALKQAVEQKRFGKLAVCSTYLKWWREQSYYDSAAWRGTRDLDGGGALMNQGIHAVDLLQWIVGMPAEVFAFSGCLAHERIEVEDTISVSMRFGNGALGVIEASTACKPGFNLRMEISGSKGSAILENDRIIFWEFDEALPEDEAIRSGVGGKIGGGSSDPKAIKDEGHRLLIEDFANAIREGRAPMISGKEARNSVQLILACYQSSQENRPIKIQ